MNGFVKLFSSIVTSSVWCEPDPILRVWIAMLATADVDGVVQGSIPGFASLSRVSVDDMRAAIAKLTGPDPDSRTKERDGQRIEEVPGGWRILNYAAYREKGQEKGDGSRAPYFREYRKRRKIATSATQATRIATENATDPVSRNTEERREKTEERTETDLSASPTSEKPTGPEWEVFHGWEKLTDTKTRSAAVRTKIVNRIKARLKERFTVDQLLACVEFASRDDFYREKGYGKNPEVLWKDAARVESLCQRLAQLQNGSGSSTVMDAQREASRLFLADEEVL